MPERVRGKVLLARPSGFCAGVDRAIDAVRGALAEHGRPVYVRGEIIHSEHVIAELEREGARFVASEEDVPEGAVCIFSAHGVAPSVRRGASRRGLRVIDATCPLVAKVHTEVRRYADAGRTIVLIGHRGHEEVEGTFGEAPERTHVVATVDEIEALPIPPDAPVAYAVQTTLAVDEAADLVDCLRRRFADLVGPGRNDICYASQNRQAAVKAIAGSCDVVLVAGARNSSNSNRLVEVAEAAGTRAHLVPDASDLRSEWVQGARSVGLSAGASAPQRLIDAIVDRLAELGYPELATTELTTERVRFPAPRGVL
jgi:4-hydroxy-3-methylbut-2-enyl diphosphate reductase